MNGESHPRPEPQRPLAEWLDRSRAELEQQIEQSEDPRELLFMASKLLEMETRIELYFAGIRALIQQRIEYVTGRVKGQG